MEKLDFENPLHFEEFPPVSTEEWESVIERDLKGKNYKDVLRWHSGEGLEPLPFYRKEDLDELSYDPAPLENKSSWHILEITDSTDVKSANKKALNALENGASGLAFAPGKNFIESKADLEKLFNNIQIELIAIKFGSAVSTPETARWLGEIVSDRELKINDLNVTFDFDPFALALLTGQLPSTDSIKDTADKFNEAIRHCGVNLSIYGNSGASIVQQIAFALAAGNEYLGMDPNSSKSLHFNFSVGPHYFLEIAKFRAFKLVWQQVLNEYGQAHSDPYISAETGFWNKAATDAHNNMLRSTTEAMSAAIGGCNAITVHRYNEHFAGESEFASRIARNIQLILQEESYLDKVADPGAGSYYIEALTDSIAKKSWDLFQEIESKGGFYECLKSGFIQQLISTSRDKKITAYKEKEKALIGVNKYKPDEKKSGSVYQAPDLSFSDLGLEGSIEIPKIEPLNIENELQNGEG